MNRKIILQLLLMNVIWAGSYSATKTLMAHAPFFLVTSLRYWIAALPLLVLAYARVGLKMNLRDLVQCSLIGVATFTLCPVLMYAGVDQSRAADAAILTATEPLLVSIGAFVYLKEKVERRTAVALLIAFGGAMLLSEFWKESASINPLGPFLIMAGVFFESLYSVLGKELLARHSPLKVTAVAIGIACLVNTIALTALGMWRPTLDLTLFDWGILAFYLAGLCTAVGYTFWYMALQIDRASNVAITIFTQPVIGILIAWLWVNETPALAQIFGTAVILAAVSFAILRPAKAANRGDS